MPNWNHIVRQHLAVLRLPPEREIKIVEEMAQHLADFGRIVAWAHEGQSAAGSSPRLKPLHSWVSLA
jgi:hypothetical protein